MTTTPPTPPIENPAPATTTAPRKRGLWWKVLLGVVVALLVLVLLAPTILSTGMGKNMLMGQLNSRMPGTVTLDSLSLGWFSGAAVKNLEMKDDAGKSVISLAGIDTGITLWNVLTGSVIDLKTVKVSGAKTPQLPGCTVNIDLVGTADLGKKLVNITGDSKITALDDGTKTGTIITIAPGSKISYGGDACDANITIDYTLDQIQKIIQSSLPEGTVLAGRRSVKLHVTGALTNDAKLRAYRGINIDETSVGWDRVDLNPKGVHLGKADVKFKMAGGVLTLTPTSVPANNGTLLVTGKVDFNADPPAYIIEKQPGGSPLVKGLGLNKEITAGPLKFLPINWGNKGGNIAEVGGQVNINVAEAYLPLDAAAMNTKATLAGALNVSNITTEAPFLAEVTKALGPVIKMTQPDLFTIRGGAIPDVPFALKDGKVSYQNLRLGTSKVNLTFSGSVGLDNSLTMNMEVTAQKLTVPVPVGLKGTTTNPELTITGLPGLGNPEDLGKTLQKEGPALLDQFLKNKKK